MTRNNRQIFQEPTDQDEDDFNVVYLGGFVQHAYTFWEIAQAYKVAGDILVEKVLSKKFEGYELIYPILFNYRHCLELYLKSFVFTEVKESHNLKFILEKFEIYIKEHHKINVPTEYKKMLLELYDFDKNSTAFRYPGEIKSQNVGDYGEFRIHLVRLKETMNDFKVSFDRIAEADPNLKRIKLK